MARARAGLSKLAWIWVERRWKGWCWLRQMLNGCKSHLGCVGAIVEKRRSSRRFPVLREALESICREYDALPGPVEIEA